MLPDHWPKLRPLDRDEWKVLRDARLNALAESPQSFLAEYSREEKYDQERWQTEFDRGEWTIGELGDRHVCLTGVTRESGAPEDKRYLEYVWVAPDFRGRGIAFNMINQILERLKKSGIRTVFLWVLDDNDNATRLYKRLGFVSCNHRQPLEAQPGRSEELMKMDLG